MSVPGLAECGCVYFSSLPLGDRDTTPFLSGEHIFSGGPRPWILSLFSYLHNKYLLNACFVSGSILGVWEKLMNKQIPTPVDAHILEGDRDAAGVGTHDVSGGGRAGARLEPLPTLPPGSLSPWGLRLSPRASPGSGCIWGFGPLTLQEFS